MSLEPDFPKVLRKHQKKLRQINILQDRFDNEEALSNEELEKLVGFEELVLLVAEMQKVEIS